MYFQSLLHEAKICVCSHAMAFEEVRGLREAFAPAGTFVIARLDEVTTDLCGAVEVLALRPEILNGNPRLANAVTQPEAASILIIDAITGEDSRRQWHGSSGRRTKQDYLFLEALRAAAATSLRRLDFEVRQQYSGQVRASQVLRTAITRPIPPKDTTEAVEYLGLNRTQVVSEWRHANNSVTLKTAYDWILLWRVLLSKMPMTTWNSAADTVGLDKRRIDCIAHRLLSMPLQRVLESRTWRLRAPFRSMRDFGAANAQTSP